MNAVAKDVNRRLAAIGAMPCWQRGAPALPPPSPEARKIDTEIRKALEGVYRHDTEMAAILREAFLANVRVTLTKTGLGWDKADSRKPLNLTAALLGKLENNREALISYLERTGHKP